MRNKSLMNIYWLLKKQKLKNREKVAFAVRNEAAKQLE